MDTISDKKYYSKTKLIKSLETILLKLGNRYFSTGFIKYFKDPAWLLSEKFFRVFSELTIGIYIARYLGVELFGIYSYSIAFVLLFSPLAKLGMDQILFRELVNKPEKNFDYLNTALWLNIIGAFISFALIVLSFVLFLGTNNNNIYIFIVALSLFFQAFDVIKIYFQSKVNGKIISICLTIQLFFSSLIKIYLLIIHASLVWFVLIFLFDKILLAFALYIAKFLDDKNPLLTTFDFSIAKHLLKKSWPLIISGIAVTIYMRIDQVMIKEMLDEKQTGLYSAAVKLAEGWYFFPLMIVSSLFPAILNSKKKHEVYIHKLQQLYNLMTLIGICIGIFFTFFSNKIVILLYGADFSYAASVLTISIWAGLFVSWGIARGKWIIAEDLQNYTVIFFVGGALINVVANYILIPNFGIKGAAFATCFSQMSASILIPCFFSKTRLSVKMLLRSLIFFVDFKSFLSIVKNNREL